MAEKQKKPQKTVDWSTFKGKFFHTFDEEGYVKYQGEILDLIGDDIAVVLYYEWFAGSPTIQKAVWVSDIIDDGWALYGSREEMTQVYEIGLVKKRTGTRT
ncbi:hypothetical protein ACFLU4_00560 [Chloroflexota bacterium]